MRYVIYKATLPNGKIYIGRTNNLTRRIREHFLDSTTAFDRTLKFFEESTVTWEVLEETNFYYKSMGREIAHIIKCQANNPEIGYNRTRGGFYDKYDATKSLGRFV
jgi:hypothetical protein